MPLNAADEKTSSSEYQLSTYKVEDMTIPIATKTVSPRLRRGQIGTEVKMLFVVNEKGRATGIRTSNRFSDSPDLAGAMSQVLRRWEFEPARDKNGFPVAVQVSLPVKVVKSGSKNRQHASLAVAKLSIVPVADK